MDKIEIYTSKDCDICTQTKDELIKNKIKFKEKNIDKFEEEFIQIVNFTSMPQTPTVYYKENYFVPARDFNNPQHLVGIIQNFKPCSLPNDIQIIEKIKTLNYNIGLAFSGTDKLLKQIESKLNINEDEHESTN